MVISDEFAVAGNKAHWSSPRPTSTKRAKFDSGYEDHQISSFGLIESSGCRERSICHEQIHPTRQHRIHSSNRRVQLLLCFCGVRACEMALTGIACFGDTSLSSSSTLTALCCVALDEGFAES